MSGGRDGCSRWKVPEAAGYQGQHGQGGAQVTALQIVGVFVGQVWEWGYGKGRSEEEALKVVAVIMKLYLFGGGQLYRWGHLPATAPSYGRGRPGQPLP